MSDDPHDLPAGQSPPSPLLAYRMELMRGMDYLDGSTPLVTSAVAANRAAVIDLMLAMAGGLAATDPATDPGAGFQYAPQLAARIEASAERDPRIRAWLELAARPGARRNPLATAGGLMIVASEDDRRAYAARLSADAERDGLEWRFHVEGTALVMTSKYAGLGVIAGLRTPPGMPGVPPGALNTLEDFGFTEVTARGGERTERLRLDAAPATCVSPGGIEERDTKWAQWKQEGLKDAAIVARWRSETNEVVTEETVRQRRAQMKRRQP